MSMDLRFSVYLIMDANEVALSTFPAVCAACKSVVAAVNCSRVQAAEARAVSDARKTKAGNRMVFFCRLSMCIQLWRGT